MELIRRDPCEKETSGQAAEPEGATSGRRAMLLALLAASSADSGTRAWTAHDASCPQVTTVGSEAFNLTEWVRATWFIQEQQITKYQPLDALYCVAATYNLEGATVPFFRGTVVSVYNYANNGRVNGPNTNADNTTLCARAVNATDSSRLAVAPCFLPNVLSGPYWVIGLGRQASDPDRYEWAVVIGGEPTVSYDDGCTTKEDSTNHAGLWLFSRARVATPQTIESMHALLKAQGVSRERLHRVEHEGCKYAGAVLK